jgi:hypothetical protein
MWAGGIFVAMCLWMLLIRNQMDLLCACIITGTLLLVTMLDRGIASILTLAYLTIMGDIRRIVAVLFGQPRLDLLLLVAPVFVVILALPIALKLRLKDRLSKAMLLFLVVMSCEMFNPQQGGVAVGVTGALFYIVPVLWFWVGREIGDISVLRTLLYKCLLPLAVCAAVMGVCQTFIGFLPYQQAWITLVAGNYHSLHVGSSVRAFGFSVSAAEYATLLAFGAVGSAAAYWGGRRVWMLAFPLLLTAVVIASGRTIILKLILALAIVWTLRRTHRVNSVMLLRLAFVTVIGLIAVYMAASRFADSSTASAHGKTSAVQDALSHQAGGLAHPLDQRYSTAGKHGNMIANGIKQGFVDPIGHGLGATTLAARQFGGDTTTASSEIDFSDMFISLGIVGGLIYIYILGNTVGATVWFVQSVPKDVGLPVLAILATTLGAWLIAGQYSTSALVFFLIGAIVRERNVRSLTPQTSLEGITSDADGGQRGGVAKR